MHSKISRDSSFFLVLTAFFSFLVPNAEARASAADDIKLSVSTTDKCDGFDGTSYAVYATNTTSDKRISGDFQYDTNPSGQAFDILNADLNAVTDQFPKYHEYRLAPGERARIGCTYTIRASSNPKIPAKIPLLITLRGAVYVDPSKPEPPAEEARPFAAFIVQHGFTNGCGPKPQPDAVLFALNLHPYRPLKIATELQTGGSQHIKASFPASALSATRAACKDGAPSVASVDAVSFTDLKKGHKR